MGPADEIAGGGGKIGLLANATNQSQTFYGACRERLHSRQEIDALLHSGQATTTLLWGPTLREPGEWGILRSVLAPGGHSNALKGPTS